MLGLRVTAFAGRSGPGADTESGADTGVGIARLVGGVVWALRSRPVPIAAHASQLVATPAERRAPVLPVWALARVLRPFEMFIANEALP